MTRRSTKDPIIVVGKELAPEFGAWLQTHPYPDLSLPDQFESGFSAGFKFAQQNGILTEGNCRTFIKELIEDAERDFVDRVVSGEVSIDKLIE